MIGFTIALGLCSLYFAVVRGAPASISANDAVLNSWKSLMDPRKGENHGLQESVAVFTDAKKMPFTVSCYTEPCCKKPEDVLCPSYYELMLAVNASSNVATFNVTGIQESVANPTEISPADAEQFCRYFAKIFANYNVTWSNNALKDEIQHEVYCSTLCIMSDGAPPKLYVKPICNAMSLMSAALQNAPPAVKPTSQQSPAAASEQAKAQEIVKPQPERTDAKPPAIVTSVKKEQYVNKDEPKTILKVGSQNKTTVASLIPAVSPVQVNPELTQKLAPTKEKVLEEPVKNEKNPAEIVPKVSLVEQPKKPAEQPPEEVQNPENKVEQSQETQKSVTSQQDAGLEEIKEENNIPVKGNEQIDDPNSETYQENADDLQKSDQKNYSDEKDVDEFNPPQADTQQTLKDPTDVEMIERKAQKILTQTSDGVSANYLPASDPFYEESGSNFFTYFLAAMFVCILLYVLYHNKTKVLALILEGRRGQKGRGGRRKHTAQYRKLDTNLEEAITSSASGRSSQIIY